MAISRKLISYISPGAPATRRPADGNEPFLRIELGFTPRWYRQFLNIDFGEVWHTDPAYRQDAIIKMKEILKQHFPEIASNEIPELRDDILTGVFGACAISAIYGVPIIYFPDNWPNCGHKYLTDEKIENLEPPDLDDNPFFKSLLRQLDWIEKKKGIIAGYVNLQGVLNNAIRLRGEQLMLDMLESPRLAKHLLECVCRTMTDAAGRIQARQESSGFKTGFFTVSNCMVNMVSPEIYEEFLLPLDVRIAEEFKLIGVHNCAWRIDPYLEHYRKIPNVAYIDMGLNSDFKKAKSFFPDARRAVMYPPVDIANKNMGQIRNDLGRIAEELGPCDLVCADIEAGVPDSRVIEIHALCRELSLKYGK